MEFSREKIKQIRHLMLLAAVLVLALIYSEKVFVGAGFLFGILTPFVMGGVIAFVLNIPMRVFEEKFLGRWKGQIEASCEYHSGTDQSGADHHHRHRNSCATGGFHGFGSREEDSGISGSGGGGAGAAYPEISSVQGAGG